MLAIRQKFTLFASVPPGDSLRLEAPGYKRKRPVTAKTFYVRLFFGGLKWK
jgi:hypothetical protein